MIQKYASHFIFALKNSFRSQKKKTVPSMIIDFLLTKLLHFYIHRTLMMENFQKSFSSFFFLFSENLQMVRLYAYCLSTFVHKYYCFFFFSSFDLPSLRRCYCFIDFMCMRTSSVDVYVSKHCHSLRIWFSFYVSAVFLWNDMKLIPNRFRFIWTENWFKKTEIHEMNISMLLNSVLDLNPNSFSPTPLNAIPNTQASKWMSNECKQKCNSSSIQISVSPSFGPNENWCGIRLTRLSCEKPSVYIYVSVNHTQIAFIQIEIKREKKSIFPVHKIEWKLNLNFFFKLICCLAFYHNSNGWNFYHFVI